ncbi:MAG: ParB/RepB/Spo0J family partition protein [Candidatus Moranbacteria bacterium]|nr:ParB/RepB/Spo0J family partition protein [Candidatus Moranbacteria bacterium]
MTDKIYSDVEMIYVTEIKPSLFENPNEFSEELYQSFKKDVEDNGLIGNPIILDKRNNSILDGNHRLAVLKDLGYSTAPCVFYEPADDIEAKILAISLNQKRGTFNEQRLHNLIKDIYDSGRYSLLELKDKLGFNLSQLKEKLETIKVDEDLIKKVEKEAMESENNMPVLMNFVIEKEHVNLVLEALELAGGKTKGEKLAGICREFLYRKIDEEKPTR